MYKNEIIFLSLYICKNTLKTDQKQFKTHDYKTTARKNREYTSRCQYRPYLGHDQEHKQSSGTVKLRAFWTTEEATNGRIGEIFANHSSDKRLKFQKMWRTYKITAKNHKMKTKHKNNNQKTKNQIIQPKYGHMIQIHIF